MAAVTQFQRLGSLNTVLYALTILEAGRPTSQRQLGWFLAGERLAQASLPAPGGLLAVFGTLWPDFTRPSPCVHVRLSAPAPPFYQGTATRDEGSPQSPHLNLVICKHRFPNKVTFSGMGAQDFSILLGDTIQYVSPSHASWGHLPNKVPTL